MIIPESLTKSKITKWQRSEGEFSEQIEADYRSIIRYLPKQCAAVWDIGAGLCGIDIFLGKHYSDAAFYLTDFDHVDGAVFFGFNPGGYCAYNSFEIAAELLELNGFENLVSFDIIGGKRRMPDCADLIISLLSCGFHYPVDTYLDEINNRSYIGTVLILDIRKGEESQVESIRKYFTDIGFVNYKKWTRWVFEKI